MKLIAIPVEWTQPAERQQLEFKFRVEEPHGVGEAHVVALLGHERFEISRIAVVGPASQMGEVVGPTLPAQGE